MTGLVDIVKSTVNILDWANDHLERVYRAGKNQAVACCPLHDDRTPSLSISGDVGLWYCHGCQRGGNLVQLVALMHVISDDDAARSILSWAGHDGDAELAKLQRRATALADAVASCRQNPIPREAQREIHTTTFYRARVGFGAFAGGAVISDHADINYACRGRVTFPITNTMNEIVAISGRGLGDATPKYVLTRAFDKANSWFRVPPTAEEMSITATVVVEGQYDALRVAYHVWAGANIEVVALCGCSMSDKIAAVLAKRSGPIILMLDGDVAGRAGTAKAWRALRAAGLPDARNRVVHLPDGYDPDTYLREAADRGDYEVLPTMLRESRPMRLGEARAEVYRELARCATEGDDARERRLLEQLHREEGVQ